MSLKDFISESDIKQKKKIYIFLIGFAIVLNIVENLIPKPVPWFRLGLTKIALLLVVYSFDFKYVIVFPVFRTVVAFLITGLLFTPVFLWSISGSICSAVLMYILVHSKVSKYFSLYGVSISGAVTHSIIQWLLIIYFFDLHYVMVLPFVLLLAVVSGFVTAYFAGFIDKTYKK